MSRKAFIKREVTEKSYRAIRHDVVRRKQIMNSNAVHHPDEKINQIHRVLGNFANDHQILELFSGYGNLTKVYSEYGQVLDMDKKRGTGDSFFEYHRLIADKRKFTVIDIDPYGFPSRLFPDVFLLINRGYLFVTCPIPSVNILNGITRTHLMSYFGNDKPSIEQIIEKIALFGLCHWRQVQEVDRIKIGRLWRIVFSVELVKATTYTGVRNR